MVRLAVICLVILMIPVLAWSQCKDCPGTAQERCSCSEFHRYAGEAALTGVNVMIKADSQCGDAFQLLIRDERGRKVAVIPLTGPHAGDHTYSFKLSADVPASSIRQAVLVNNTAADVAITYMKVTGILVGGEHVYFEKECPGVVIGAKGCQRMVLYQGDAPAAE